MAVLTNGISRQCVILAGHLFPLEQNNELGFQKGITTMHGPEHEEWI